MQSFIRLTWNTADPAPFESAWSVFAKIISLNYCRPLDVVEAIKREDIGNLKNLNFRDSSWIDFERFGRALGVDPSRLRACFLDQLGFPRVENLVAGGVKLCPACWAKGYHSVFFELELINGCPMHKIPLERQCKGCKDAVSKKGLKVTQSEKRSISGAKSLVGIYHSECEHIAFNSNDPIAGRLLTKDDENEIKGYCLEILNWWSRTYRMPHGKPELVASLGRINLWRRYVNRINFDDQEIFKDLQMRLGIAVDISGNCPWPTVVQSIPTNWAVWHQAPYSPKNRVESPLLANDYKTAYKSVRRYIFRRYVRQHRSCWNELSNTAYMKPLAFDIQTLCLLGLCIMENVD